MPGPGIDVATAVRPAPTERNPAPGSAFFVVGVTERGDTAAAVELRSMGDYLTKMGDWTTYGTVYDVLDTYFREGGGLAYVARVVGPAAVVGSRVVNDRAGTPLPTMRVEAANPGPWSARVTFDVVAGITTNTFNLVVRLDGNVVEQNTELPDVATAVTRFAASNYIRVVNLNSATAPPNNLPALASGQTLSTAGTDDRTNITDTIRVAALTRFPRGLGAGLVAVPYSSSTTVQQGIIDHGKANQRIGATAPAAGSNVAAAVSAANALRSYAGAEYLGIFYPWVVISDGSGGQRTIPPEGFVAGVRSRTAASIGLWQWPAGSFGLARAVMGTETKLEENQKDQLATARVTPIWQLNTGVQLYGWYSLSPDEKSFKSLAARDLLNDLHNRVFDALQEFLFWPIDQRHLLQDAIESKVRGILEPIRAAGGLRPTVDDNGFETDAGYVVDAGPTLNPPSVQVTDTVKVAVSVRPSGIAERISVLITRVATDAPL